MCGQVGEGVDAAQRGDLYTLQEKYKILLNALDQKHVHAMHGLT